MSFCDAPEKVAAAVRGGSDERLRWANHVLELYGVRRFLADVDRRREFWREGGVVGETLSWLADEGWERYFSLFGGLGDDAEKFRQRHVLVALADLRRSAFW